MRMLHMLLLMMMLPLAALADHLGDPELEAYYAGTEGISGTALRDALHEIIEAGHDPLPYTGSTAGSGDIWEALRLCCATAYDSSDFRFDSSVWAWRPR